MTRYSAAKSLTSDQAQAAARRLRELRAQQKMSQCDLAALSGVPQQTISGAEKAAYRLSVARAEMLAGALGTDLAGLLEAGAP